MAEAVRKKVGRTPPSSLEAEQSILGSMFLSEKCVYEALESLKEEDFYYQQNREIFAAMALLMNTNVPIDFVTVSKKLEEEGKAREGGLEYLSSLTDVVPSIANLRHYINIVEQASSKRKMIDTSMQAMDECFEGELSADEIIGRASDALYKIALKESQSSMVPLREAVQASYLEINEAMSREGGLMGLPTGFPRMDEMLSGLQGTQLIVIAGRPGMGKTSFAMNIVEHVGIVKNNPCLVFSLEMSARQLATRLLCSEAQIDSQLVRSGKVTSAHITKLADAMKVLSAAPITIDDASSVTVTEMLAKANRLKSQSGLSLVVIDYLQLMQATGRAENRQQEISQITRSLKIMAKELDVPILLLSQLSRASEKRDKKSQYPMLSDLRESGAIEQDADVVIFLQRDDYHPEDQADPSKKGQARIMVAKQRNGPTGNIQVEWLAQYTKYKETDFMHTDDGGSSDGYFSMDEGDFEY